MLQLQPEIQIHLWGWVLTFLQYASCASALPGGLQRKVQGKLSPLSVHLRSAAETACWRPKSPRAPWHCSGELEVPAQSLGDLQYRPSLLEGASCKVLRPGASLKLVISLSQRSCGASEMSMAALCQSCAYGASPPSCSLLV